MRVAAVAVVAVALTSAIVAVGARSAATPAAQTFRASVSAQTRRPVAGTRWRYTVRIVNEKGHPAAGTAIVRVVVNGRRRDTIGWFGVPKGLLQRQYRWPQTMRGLGASLQVEVRRRGATKVVAYAVRVSPVTGKPAFTATLGAQSRTPRAGTPWRYVVRARAKSGRPFSGTVIMRVLRGGRIVDTIGWFGFKRTFAGAYRFNSVLRGMRAVLTAEVRGPGGARVLVLPVRVR